MKKQEQKRLPFYPELQDGPEERELGIAGGWRFVIRPAPDVEGLFFLWKKSLSREDHGERIILEVGYQSQAEVERIADKRIARIEARQWF
jgi:hypothetical protein